MEIKHLPMYIINVFHNMLEVYSKITCLRINDVKTQNFVKGKAQPLQMTILYWV